MCKVPPIIGIELKEGKSMGAKTWKVVCQPWKWLISLPFILRQLKFSHMAIQLGKAQRRYPGVQREGFGAELVGDYVKELV